MVATANTTELCRKGQGIKRRVPHMVERKALAARSKRPSLFRSDLVREATPTLQDAQASQASCMRSLRVLQCALSSTLRAGLGCWPAYRDQLAAEPTARMSTRQNHGSWLQAGADGMGRGAAGAAPVTALSRHCWGSIAAPFPAVRSAGGMLASGAQHSPRRRPRRR